MFITDGKSKVSTFNFILLICVERLFVFCSKTLFWLPRILPPKAHFIVSLNASDDKKLAELTEERGYDTINIAPLKEPEREEIALVRYIMHQELHLTNEARTSVQIAYF